MEGLFDILFIIVTVIIFFVSVFRKANKENDTSRDSSYVFEGIPENYGIPNTEQADPADEDNAKEKPADDLETVNPRKDKAMRPNRNEEILLEKRSNKRKKRIIKDFSPKKAIIYSEIIHPKYF